jgi:hypothetical protein
LVQQRSSVKPADAADAALDEDFRLRVVAAAGHKDFSSVMSSQAEFTEFLRNLWQ